jgi:hypothetical protein
MRNTTKFDYILQYKSTLWNGRPVTQDGLVAGYIMIIIQCRRKEISGETLLLHIELRGMAIARKVDALLVFFQADAHVHPLHHSFL